MSAGLTPEEQNMASVRTFVEEAINQGKLEKVDQCIADNFVDHHGLPGMEKGRDSVKKAINAFRTAFPDLHFTIDGIMSEGNKVVVRWTGNGTFNQEFLGNPPANKPLTVAGVDIIRMENGKVAERWASYDYFGVLLQLDMVPEPAKLPR